MLRRAKLVKKRGFRKYKGDLEQIIRQIIDSCWNGTYLQVSSGHFNEFYCRDFGMCAEALVSLGYRDMVIKTLDYALSKFRKHGRITTSISPRGVCFDFPGYGADSLPFIIHAIRVSGARDVFREYRDFLTDEVDYYHDNVFDGRRFLVRDDKYFSSMKDHAKRSSSCYSNCMLYMLSRDLEVLNLKSPFSPDIIREEIVRRFWNGKYFYDEVSGMKIATGDANTFPFWCGVTKSKHKFRLCMEAMEQAGLTTPFPLKYSAERSKIHNVHLIDMFAGDYERDAIWMHLGLCFLDVVKQYDKKRFNKYMDQYAKLIKNHKTFLEVYDCKGRPFRTRFYITDESMLWASKYLHLKNQRKS